MYNAVLGEAMKHSDLVGVVSSGTIEVQSLESNTTWGNKNVRFEPHNEIWQIRSFPKDRIGMSLKPDELREVIVLLRNGTNKTATVSTIRIWRMQGLLREIAAYEFGMNKAHALIEMNTQQVVDYDKMHNDVEAEMCAWGWRGEGGGMSSRGEGISIPLPCLQTPRLSRAAAITPSGQSLAGEGHQQRSQRGGRGLQQRDDRQ